MLTLGCSLLCTANPVLRHPQHSPTPETVPSRPSWGCSPQEGLQGLWGIWSVQSSDCKDGQGTFCTSSKWDTNQMSHVRGKVSGPPSIHKGKVAGAKGTSKLYVQRGPSRSSRIQAARQPVGREVILVKQQASQQTWWCCPGTVWKDSSQQLPMLTSRDWSGTLTAYTELCTVFLCFTMSIYIIPLRVIYIEVFYVCKNATTW